MRKFIVHSGVDKKSVYRFHLSSGYCKAISNFIYDWCDLLSEDVTKYFEVIIVSPFVDNKDNTRIKIKIIFSGKCVGSEFKSEFEQDVIYNGPENPEFEPVESGGLTLVQQLNKKLNHVLMQERRTAQRSIDALQEVYGVVHKVIHTSS